MATLNESNLALLPSTVARPNYDRSKLKAGILHFGVGGFHRAHQAMSIDRLLNLGLAEDWAICGIGLLEGDRRMAEVFERQDNLFTVILKHADGRKEATVIGSIVDYLFAPDDAEAVIEKLAHPDTKIVSLTITEGGYNFDRVTGEFDETNPGVVADLVPARQPTTIFGFITAGLARRKERGLKPFTVLSCDNIPGNGDMAKAMFSAFARLKDSELARWIEAEVQFPNSMVDRITPVTSQEDVALTREITGLDDAWPVVCEPFFQWVIEDEFTLGRPPLEKVDVQFTQDVMPFELMKLRLLNASHQGLCYFGYLSGYRFAHEAMADPAIATFLRRYMDEEGTPTLPEVPGVDLAAYKDTLIERFSNPEIRDTLARLCAESSDRIPKWLIPVVQEQLTAGRSVTLSAAIVASWARYAEAVDESGQPISIVDPLKEELVPIAQSQRQNPLAFIQNKKLFGNLAENQIFVHAYLQALNSLFEKGAHATVVSLAERHN
jgi:mannitol 2-dehydrogenase